MQRVQLKQPSEQALERLARIDGTLLNFVEPALDLIFSDSYAAQKACEFTRRHFWHKRPGNNQLKVVYETTFYSARNWAPRGFVGYGDRHSKLTGEVYCTHLEWRIAGRRSLQRHNIHGVADLLEFDHRKFWEEHLLLYEVNLEKLGRLFHDRRKRKQPIPAICRPTAMDGSTAAFTVSTKMPGR